MMQPTTDVDAERIEYEQAATAVLAADDEGRESPVLQMTVLGNALLAEFDQADNDRRETVDRWLQDLRQYRGKYDPDVEARIADNRSKAFVRKTRVKVKTVDSRVGDLLFPAGTEKNWDVGPTPKPSLSPDQLQEIRAALMVMAQGQKITRPMFELAVKEWAKKRAKAMALTIDDQLAESNYKQICQRVIHSGNLYGTGILKGPLVERKMRTRFVRNGDKWVAQTESYVVPFVDYVPLWRFYPDMSVTELKDCRFTYERHLMSKSEMADLARRKSFRGDVIKAYVLANTKGEVTQRYADTELRIIGSRNTGLADFGGKYELLERWGWLDGEQLKQAGVEVPDDRLHESFFSNVWLLPNGEVIKAVLQPISAETWPYHLYYFDKDESSIFAEGLATIMRDDQSMINASTRLMIDNAAASSGAQLEVSVGLLASQEKADEFSPWKVWLRNNSNPGSPAIRVVELPSRMGDLSKMTQIFENNADEVSAVPRYMSGENATTGAAGTSSGLSMLIGNVNIVIKDLITNWDEGVTSSFIRGLYSWNMQFNPDDAIKGDFDVKARGTSSLVAKEVRARQLNEFATLTANALDAPYIKRDVLNRQRAEANELADVVKSEDEVIADQNTEAAKMQAQMVQQSQQLALAEQQAKVAKLTADAQAVKAKASETLANIELIVAKAVDARVGSAYAALQAAGVATSSPGIAPAGDEILRSSGWKDATPEPTIAQLDGPPVQQEQGTRGQEPAMEPHGGADNAPLPEDPAAGVDESVNPPSLEPQTGMVGRHDGIETPRID